MSVLKNLESKIAGLVEGAFGRAFRSEVKPLELARRLTREMDDHRTVSLNRTYVPNEYVVWLSPEDRAHYVEIEQRVCEELEAYLLEHARAEGLALARVPQVAFETDERLALGESQAEARLVASGSPQGAPAEPEDWFEEPAGHTMIFSRAGRLQEPLEQAGRSAQAVVVLPDGETMLVGPHGAVLGRSRECDVRVAATDVSRRHAKIELTEQGWAIEDLGSTNGVRVNGQALSGRLLLGDGDQIQLGDTRVGFELR